ncbi:MAG: hypothetical protein J5889_01625 [Clostridia bacterium]|nr:hypothetical protein [Clostridia bacterium]
MLKVLLKKQLADVFKSYFYDAKKNRMRSKGAIAGWFIFFFVIMVGMMGGMFTGVSILLCGPLTEAGMGWMYFMILGGLSIFMGAFGSVFNTYSGLYLAKDNDLLLSLPIPVRTIMTARLLNVYLLGTMYLATVLIPALIVYWAVAGLIASRLICGILLFVSVSFVVLLLSCVLGWVVARISLKLRNKSFVTVAASLVFVGAYYFFYFKAADVVRDIIANAVVYGEKIKGAAYGVYMFGRIGEGDWLATLIFVAVTGILFALVWYFMTRSFLNIATASGAIKKTRYVEKPVREKSIFGALLSKELGRFTASPNYMLNCGLSTILIPGAGILLLIKGREICEMLESVLASRPGAVPVLIATILCMLTSMNDMAAPSVSLEGKNLWILQSLPVIPKMALRAKASLQMLLTGIPVIFAAICAAVILPVSPALRALVIVTPLAYTVFMAMYDLTIGVKMPLLTWTNEIAPIKQSGAVGIVIFTSWGFSILLGGIYMLIGYKIGPAAYLVTWTVIYAAVALFLLRWLDRKGSRILAEL